MERSFAWAARFRRLARDCEQLASTLTGYHWLAFVRLMLQSRFAKSSCQALGSAGDDDESDEFAFFIFFLKPHGLGGFSGLIGGGHVEAIQDYGDETVAADEKE